MKKRPFLDRPRRLYLICIVFETSADRIDRLRFESRKQKPRTFYTTAETLTQARTWVRDYKKNGVRAGGGTWVLESKIVKFREDL